MGELKRRGFLGSLIAVATWPFQIRRQATTAPFAVGDVVCDTLDSRRNPMVILAIERRDDFWGGWMAKIQDSYGWISNQSLKAKMFTRCPPGTKMPERPYENPPSGNDLIRRLLNQGEDGFPFDAGDWRAELAQGFTYDGAGFMQSWTVKLTSQRGNIRNTLEWSILFSQKGKEQKWIARQK